MTASDHAVSAFTDRMAIRDLIDAYTHHADREIPWGKAAVFAEHGEVRLIQELGDGRAHPSPTDRPG